MLRLLPTKYMLKESWEFTLIQPLGYATASVKTKNSKSLTTLRYDVISGKIVVFGPWFVIRIELSPSSTAIAAMHVHVETKRAFFTNRSGQSFIYDLSTVYNPYFLIHEIECICRLCQGIFSQFRITQKEIFEGLILISKQTIYLLLIWTMVSLPSSILESLEKKNMPAAVQFWTESLRSESANGQTFGKSSSQANQDGTITFWDARKAEPICNDVE